MNDQNTSTQSVQSEERLALDELREVGIATESLIAEIAEKPTPLAESVLRAVTESEVNVMRDRARRQRERGVQHIARRYDGVASMILPVEINERVVGSAFERFFSVIENGIYFISRRGEMFVGEAAAEKIMATIVQKISDMETNVQADLAGLKIQMEVHAENKEFLVPVYVAPASKHSVQVRTPMAAKVVQLFLKQDKVVSTLQALSWNGEVEATQIFEQELRIKKDVRDLASFIARTLRGMRKVVTAKAEANESAAQPTAPLEAVA